MSECIGSRKCVIDGAFRFKAVLSNTDPLLASTAAPTAVTTAAVNSGVSLPADSIPAVVTDKLIPVQCLVEVR